jgi:hypothetical protein
MIVDTIIRNMRSIITFPGLMAAASLLSSCAVRLNDQADFTPVHATFSQSSSQRLPDPRFRPAFGDWEIDSVASMVAKTTGHKVSGSIVISEESPLARIRGPLDSGEILINPRAAATIPPNSWAFIIGHEFAHRTHELGNHGQTNPELEFQADVVGARYAMDAGFDLAAHIAWTLSLIGNRWSSSHGSLHDRAERLGHHYGISQQAVANMRWRYESISKAQ